LMCEQQDTPPLEETLSLTQDTITQIMHESTPDESSLLSLLEGPSKNIPQSDKGTPVDVNMDSNHETIHEITEDFNTSEYDQEQSFSTTPLSLGSSVGPTVVTRPLEIRKDKGKGCACSTSSKESGTSPC
jgi:hypothetical protein